MVFPSGEKMGLSSLLGWMVSLSAGEVFWGLVEIFHRSFSHENTSVDPSGDSAGVTGISIWVSADVLADIASAMMVVKVLMMAFMVVIWLVT